jgi:hypothetical protein
MPRTPVYHPRTSTIIGILAVLASFEPLAVARAASILKEIKEEDPNDPAIRQAERLYQDAQRLIENGDFGRALPLLEGSLRSRQTPGAMLNQALCLFELHRYAEALAVFRRYLHQYPNRGSREQQADIQDQIRQCEELVGEIMIEVESPPAVNVSLDDVELGCIGGCSSESGAPVGLPLEVSIGPHVIGLSAEGYQPERHEVTVVSHGYYSIPARLVAVGQVQAESPTSGPAPSNGGNRAESPPSTPPGENIVGPENIIEVPTNTNPPLVQAACDVSDWHFDRFRRELRQTLNVDTGPFMVGGLADTQSVEGIHIALAYQYTYDVAHVGRYFHPEVGISAGSYIVFSVIPDEDEGSSDPEAEPEPVTYPIHPNWLWGIVEVSAVVRLRFGCRTSFVLELIYPFSLGIAGNGIGFFLSYANWRIRAGVVLDNGTAIGVHLQEVRAEPQGSSSPGTVYWVGGIYAGF